MRLGIAPIKPNRAAKLRDRRVNLPQFDQRNPKPIMKSRIVPVHPNRARKTSRRFIQLPRLPQIFPKIRMIIGNIPPNPNRPRDHFNRKNRLPPLPLHNPQQMQRIRILRPPRQHLPINPLRLPKPPSPMMHQPRINRPRRKVARIFVTGIHASLQYNFDTAPHTPQWRGEDY